VANTSSAKKAVRTIARRTEENKSIRSGIKTVVKKAHDAIKEGKTGIQAVRQAESSIDKAVSKGVVHKNKAARQKSRLMKRLNAASKAKA
jgi:small subunit ribosomal protein S20